MNTHYGGINYPNVLCGNLTSLLPSNLKGKRGPGANSKALRIATQQVRITGGYVKVLPIQHDSVMVMCVFLV